MSVATTLHTLNPWTAPCILINPLGTTHCLEHYIPRLSDMDPPPPPHSPHPQYKHALSLNLHPLEQGFFFRAMREIYHRLLPGGFTPTCTSHSSGRPELSRFLGALSSPPHYPSSRIPSLSPLPVFIRRKTHIKAAVGVYATPILPSWGSTRSQMILSEPRSFRPYGKRAMIKSTIPHPQKGSLRSKCSVRTVMVSRRFTCA
jgi:hypothetical protein